MQEYAKNILTHRCNLECKMRFFNGDGIESFYCRYPNNLKIGPYNTQHYIKPLSVQNTAECIDQLTQIGLSVPTTVNKHGI